MFNRDFVSASSAVGLGALVGGLLSIEIASRFSLGGFLWIFGALIGGCVAYIAADFRHFCDGVFDAYKKTVEWRPHVIYWKALLLTTSALFLTVLSVVVYVSGPLSYISGNQDKFFDVFTIYPAAAFLFLAFILSLISVERMKCLTEKQYRRQLLGMQKISYWLLIRGNPVSVPLMGLFYVWKRFLWVQKNTFKIKVRIAQVIHSIRSFVVVALKNVHTQKRAVVFFDATAGAVIGYMLGSALLGAFIGALALYPLHRELIAVRLLKVVPR